MALRWMAGGDKMDIAPCHGVGFNEVMKSVWAVVDAVNSCEELKMKFPGIYAEQLNIVEGFKKKLRAHFKICVGWVD